MPAAVLRPEMSKLLSKTPSHIRESSEPDPYGRPASSSSTADFPGVAQMPLRPGTASDANSLAQSDWSIVTSPNTSTTQNNLLGVTCVSASDCWAVGSYVAGSGAPRTLIEHW